MKVKILCLMFVILLMAGCVPNVPEIVAPSPELLEIMKATPDNATDHPDYLMISPEWMDYHVARETKLALLLRMLNDKYADLLKRCKP